MHPFRPPFGVPSRPTNPNAYRPNTTQPQQMYNFQEYDPNTMGFSQLLNMPHGYFQNPFAFNPNMVGGSQQENEPESVPETQPEPERQPESSTRPKRSHKKKDASTGRARKNYQPWTKDEEFALTRAWLDISEDPEVANYQSLPLFWARIRETFFKSYGHGEHRENDSISSKWTDINARCHAFQEVYQRVVDNWGSGCSDADILKRALEEYNATRGNFTYIRCWELLRGSPKWANVPSMSSTSSRKAKRSKTSSSVDPETPTSDARRVNLNEDVAEQEEELSRPPGRRSIRRGGRVESSSGGGELKSEFEEMNRRLQYMSELGAKRLETMQERNVENKKFVAIQESRQMQKDIEFMSKPIDHLTGDALIIAQMHRQQIREKYGLQN